LHIMLGNGTRSTCEGELGDTPNIMVKCKVIP
jgi:hypothetical protein